MDMQPKPKMKTSPGKMDMKSMPGMKMGPGEMAMGRDVADVPFQSGLINGKGLGTGDAKSPLTVLEVKAGETVRLRLINGSSTFAFRFQIDGHPLTVIASDGSPMKPVMVNSLDIDLGERYDVLLKADRGGVHWVRAVTRDNHEVLAVLRYAESGKTEPEASPIRWGPAALSPMEMRSPGPVKLAARPRVIPLRLGGSMKPYRWSIDDRFYPTPIPSRSGRASRSASTSATQRAWTIPSTSTVTRSTSSASPTCSI
jgi:FtsP/CotA-like multicopper oxidase with cupredoxin domain